MKSETIKRGSVTVRLYYTPQVSGEESWTVSWVGPEGRERKRLGAYKLAKEFAVDRAQALARGDVSVISREDASSLLRARELLAPHGVSVELAVAQWANLTELLGGTPLAEAVSFYREHKAKVMIGAAAGVKACLAVIKADGQTGRHYNDLASRLGAWASDMPGELSKLQAMDLDGWLRATQQHKKWSGLTRNHYRAALLQFLRFAGRQRWLSFDPAKFAELPLARVERSDIGIFTPDEGRKLLAAAHANYLPSLVLAMFCGIRPAEVQRVDWADVGLDAVLVDKGKVRQAGHRLVPLPPAAAAWLLPHRKPKGLVCQLVALDHAPIQTAARAKVEWRHDGPRHSFVSYRLALIGDIGRVSEESGTSPVTLRKHYRRPVPLADAKAWFEMFPVVTFSDAGKVSGGASGCGDIQKAQ